MEENDDKSALISPVNTAIATQLGNPTFKALIPTCSDQNS